MWRYLQIVFMICLFSNHSQTENRASAVGYARVSVVSGTQISAPETIVTMDFAEESIEADGAGDSSGESQESEHPLILRPGQFDVSVSGEPNRVVTTLEPVGQKIQAVRVGMARGAKTDEAASTSTQRHLGKSGTTQIDTSSLRLVFSGKRQGRFTAEYAVQIVY